MVVLINYRYATYNKNGLVGNNVKYGKQQYACNWIVYTKRIKTVNTQN